MHLKGLTGLQGLFLHNTQITDAGLEHLKGLTNLQLLYLPNTQVTDTGVKKLKQALPKCKIVASPPARHTDGIYIVPNCQELTAHSIHSESP